MGFWEYPRGDTVVSKHDLLTSWSAVYTQKSTFCNSMLKLCTPFWFEIKFSRRTMWEDLVLETYCPSHGLLKCSFFLPSSSHHPSLSLSFGTQFFPSRSITVEAPGADVLFPFHCCFIAFAYETSHLTFEGCEERQGKGETLNKWLCWERWGLTGGINGFVNALGSGRLERERGNSHSTRSPLILPSKILFPY